MRVYQRLLAMDQEEATELLREFRKTMSLEKVYDTVLLPTLAMAEEDRVRGQLDDRRQSFIRQSTRSMIDEMGDDETVLQATDSKNGDAAPSVPLDCNVNVVCLPAHDEADEIVNVMLAQLLHLRGYCATSISQNALASEMIQEVESREANVVIVSALPPAAVAHARYLCKRVHAVYPDMRMIVALWQFKGELEKAKDRITCVVNVPLVTGLEQTLKELEQMTHHVVVEQTAAAAGK
jgi:hypothetical protein